jgi:SAM-dependent methyltransferase
LERMATWQSSAWMLSFTKADRRLELLCEDHVGTYVLPFPCRWSSGDWESVEIGRVNLMGHFGSMSRSPRRMSQMTIAYYDRMAEAYWDGTRDHDVSQNYASLLDAIENDPPYSILDLGCGPGRDLRHFRSLGHNAVGLDGSKEFVAMARSYSGCEVLHQDFLAMVLPQSRFDGVFANASLFHVPSQELPRILLELRETLRPGGILFCSNPRGNNEEGFSDGRYGCFFDLDTWRNYVGAAGFFEVGHYYRPPGLPRQQQPWLATVWRKGYPP